MGNILDLEKITVEEVKALLDNGTSAQDLLIAVGRMPMIYYPSDIGKFKPSSELIAKQSELAQLCLTKGAKLKDAFKSVYDIPASFIENNLPLIIASEYSSTNILEYTVLNPHSFNNPSSLITKLIKEYQADAHQLSLISPELDSTSIKFLLENKMTVEVLLKVACESKNKEKQKELFDLAFKGGANTTSFKDLNISGKNYDEGTFKLLMNDYKVSAQDLLNVVVHAEIDQYNQATQKPEPSQELITKQIALEDFLINQGADRNVVQIDIEEASAHTLFRHAKLIIKDSSSLGDNTLDVLLSRSYILQKEHVNKEYIDMVIACYQDLLKLPESKKILDFLAFKINNDDTLKIVFAMESIRNSRHDDNNNYVYVGFNKIDSSFSFASTIIHEFAHCAIDKVFANDALPYRATQDSYSEQIKKDLEQQHQNYTKAAVEPMKLAVQILSKAENCKTEIDSSEKFVEYLKTQTLLPFYYLKYFEKHDFKENKALSTELKEVAISAIKILYTDIEIQNKHIVGIKQDDPTVELEHLKNELCNLEKNLNISKDQSIFLMRLADEAYRAEEHKMRTGDGAKDMKAEHIVRYMEFLVKQHEGILEDPRIIKSYSKLQEYWNKYIFPEMEKIMGSPPTADHGSDDIHGQEVSISGSSSVLLDRSE